MENVKYLILGAGPAGLTFASRLKQLGEDSFAVLEKENEADCAGQSWWTAARLISEADISWIHGDRW